MWRLLLALPFTALADTCTMQNGVIRGSGSLHQSKAVSPEDCCTQCFNFPGCIAFTYTTDTGACWLKDNVFNTTASPKSVSGTFTVSRTVTFRACSTTPVDKFPFCNVSLSTEERVQDLISRLSLDDKAPLLTARESPKGGVPAIGLPEYDWGANCIHGVQSRCGEKCPTTFPNPNAQGAAFNRTLWKAMAAVTGRELRALWLADIGENHPNNIPHLGLDCWSPNININRDPRWGRNLETPGEDPYLNGQYGAFHTMGLQQGEDPRYLQAIVTLKHWDAYSLEDDGGGAGKPTRHNFNAIVSNRDLADTYWPAWKNSVRQGKAKGVMCSYNAVNGVPSCASSFLLQTVLRDTWGFDGYITSDSGAITDIYAEHKYKNSTEVQAVAFAVQSGCDVDSGPDYDSALAQAVKTGLIQEKAVDLLLERTFRLKFELGLFDPMEGQPYWNYRVNDTVDTPENFALAREAVRAGMVLLQNNNQVLPFKKGLKLGVIGPHAQAQAALTGNYLGQQCADAYGSFDCIQTPADALQKANKGGSVQVAQGCGVADNSTAGFAQAVQVAQGSDAILLLMGLDTSAVEKEGHDRTSIDLPGVQLQLIQAVVKAAGSKPVALVLLNGGAVALDWVKANVNGIVEAFYPGKWGAEAIADVVFGDYNPGGKMPYTTYSSNYVNQIAFEDMNMTTGVGRTYRYFTGTPLWPFGFGMSYTSFTLSLDQTSTQSAVVIKVTNTGKRDGDEVVQVYFSPVKVSLTNPATLPRSQLVDFERAHLAAGSSTLLAFEIADESVALVDGKGNLVVAPGTYQFIFTNGVDQKVTLPYTVSGAERVLEPFPQPSTN